MNLLGIQLILMFFIEVSSKFTCFLHFVFNIKPDFPFLIQTQWYLLKLLFKSYLCLYKYPYKNVLLVPFVQFTFHLQLKHGTFLTLFNFFQQNKVTVNDFLDIIMSDPAPPCMVWLPLLHRLASVENGKYDLSYL